MAGPESFLQTKEMRVAGAAAGAFAATDERSLWEFEGNPSHGSVPPTTFALPDNTTAGSMMQTDPAAGTQKWLTAILASGAQAGRLVLYDRLLHISGFNGNIATVQNVNGGSAAAVGRRYKDPNGLGNTDDGNEIFAEIYTAVGATGTTIAAAYTDSAGSAQTTQAATFGGAGFLAAQRCIRMPLAAGGTGVQSITSLTLAAGTGTVGNFGIVVAHRLLEISLGAAHAPEVWSFINSLSIEILPGACLCWTYMVNAASAATNIPLLAFPVFVDK